MIPIRRPREPKPVTNALHKRFPDDHKTELERAREYYNKDPKPTKAYNFARYKERAVCRALDKLSNGKCAYCESRYRAVDSMDVEHFRPKGEVKEAGGKHPGYWWLAAKWTNLLPSCPACNQRRYQLEFDIDMTLEEMDDALQKPPKQTSGKSTSFPVKGNNWITKETQRVSREDPLLIDPCDVNKQPKNHLEWIFDWENGALVWEAQQLKTMVRPKKLLNGEDDPYGKTSIAVYGLNRADLFRERLERLREVQAIAKMIVTTIDAVAGTGAELDKLIARHMTTLKGFTAPHKEYSAMASAFFELFLDRLEAWKKNPANVGPSSRPSTRAPGPRARKAASRPAPGP